MFSTETIQSLNRNDVKAKQQVFETLYSCWFPIARRYAKSEAQAKELFESCFHTVLNQIKKNKSSVQAELLEKEFLKAAVSFIKEIRSEYYVASTVYANRNDSKNYDLFEAADLVDFDTVEPEILIRAIQKLVPSQRLIFNLHVIEAYTLEDSAEILEASVHTARANLEKARYNLQKNIEKCLKEARYEQSL